MGLGWGSNTAERNSPDPPVAHQDKAASPAVTEDVLKKGREQCYKARDAFYDCLGQAGQLGLKSGGSPQLQGIPSNCRHLRADYTRFCRASWVRHFDHLLIQKAQVDFVVPTQSRG